MISDRGDARLRVAIAWIGCALGASAANAQPAPEPGSVPEPEPGSVPEPDPDTITADALPPAPPAKPRRRPRNFVGLELGFGRTGDTRNLYDQGFGRTFVLGIRHWELRLYENYDLDDKSDQYDGVEYAEGRMGITSVGRRIVLREVGAIRLSALVGAAWLRRKSLRIDPDEISSQYEPRFQHGLGVLAGAGAAIDVSYATVRADLRAYPALWQDLTGDTRAVYVDGAGTAEQITESPGGVPVTVNVALGVEF